MAEAYPMSALAAELERLADELVPILLAALGGSSKTLVLSKCKPTSQDISLSPQHMFLLSCIGNQATVEELLDMTPLGALETLGLVLDFIDQGYVEAC
jgi:hypothetical protein